MWQTSDLSSGPSSSRLVRDLIHYLNRASLRLSANKLNNEVFIYWD